MLNIWRFLDYAPLPKFYGRLVTSAVILNGSMLAFSFIFSVSICAASTIIV
jgi:hypothetical protein